MLHGFVSCAAATPQIRVADPVHNAAAAIRLMEEAAAAGARLLVLPELCLTGSTCGDLFLSQILQEGAWEALLRVCAAGVGLDLLCFVGLPVSVDGGLYNCAAALYEGRLLGLVPKTGLSGDEARRFLPGPRTPRRLSLGGAGDGVWHGPVLPPRGPAGAPGGL